MSDPLPTATAIASAVRRREVTAEQVAADHLDRAEATQSTLNAFTLIEHDAALESAAAIDQRIAAGENVGPLAGVPVALKDLIDHAGRPTTAGSSYPPSIPADSATVVTRLEAAGAIVIGRTGLHEYAFGFSSENHWFGPVRNPWDPRLSPGGSSGGSASAVAAGPAAIAIGTDTGGSVRVPAALCGVVGLKVTHGRIPLTGVYPLAASLDTVGPLGRNTADVAATYLAVAGHDPTDPWSAPRKVEKPGRLVDLSDLTVGVPHPWVDLPQTKAVSESFEFALDALASAGVAVTHFEIPDLIPSRTIESSVYPEVALVHAQRWRDHPETYGPDVSRRLEAVFNTDPSSYIQAQEWRARIRHAAQAALLKCNFLATPAVAAAKKVIGEDTIEMGDSFVSYRPLLSRFSSIVNHSSLPAIVLPLDVEGSPPPSIQFIAGRWREHALLELGTALEVAGISRYRTPPVAVA